MPSGTLRAHSLSTVTGELTSGLQQLRHEQARLEAMLVTLAADPGRRARLHQVAHSTRGRLVTMLPHERRSVCELLDVRVTVQQWDTCPRCQGRKRVSGNGKAIGCPVRHTSGQVAVLRIDGLWTAC
jgi:hypothetical protein